jgi:hypothetical protein
VYAGKCIDNELISEITGNLFSDKKDKSLRENCGCVKSRDIGAYNSCSNGCIYCYANNRGHTLPAYDPDSPLLCESLKGSGRIVPGKESELQKSFLF